MQLDVLTAISPLDGRYREQIAALAELASEFGLIRYRVKVEIEWFIFLSAIEELPQFPALEDSDIELCRSIWHEFDVDDARSVREIERQTNHDVKAVEYFVRDRLTECGYADYVEFVHFGLTSEDVNNLAYGMILDETRRTLVLPRMRDVLDALAQLAKPLTEVPMLARTHGQTASPTTIGKEVVNFIPRLQNAYEAVGSVKIRGKLNGAVGNYNALSAACPQVNWEWASKAFVGALGLRPNMMTTQIEPHDYMAQLFSALTQFNQVLLDFDRDMWTYISLGYFKQRTVESEVGSSTMPHKVNPIDFENSEGNLGIADAVLTHLARKLAISRMQRDLSDSTALRNTGVGIGHSLLAYRSVLKGVAKLSVDESRLAADLADSWEVLTEAIQTTMRVHRIPKSYEKVKNLTRGRKFDESLYRELLTKLELPSEVRRRMESLTPQTYTGLAARLANKQLESMSWKT